MTTLVTGGTGTVGSQVVVRLAALGQPVRVLTRSAEKAATLPEGVTGLLGALAEPSTLGAAFEGVERLFLLTPLAQDEVDQGLAGIEAAREAGVGRIVFMSVHHADQAPQIPHFASKVEIARGLERSGIPYTVIEPNSFYQNDLGLQQPLMEFGVYPMPLGSVGLHRVDVRDIADAAVAALTKDGHQGEHYPVVGPELCTGEGSAQAWAAALGSGVIYAGDDLDAWSLAASAMMPDWLVADLRVMFEHFQERGLLATADDFTRQRGLIGREPIGFDRFATEAAAIWKSQVAGA
ncbi:MAG: NmrA family NAD(P)-binding protein [marine benthic group bacterium]|nr:NmrA family NAD(P)-binding protein [Candidatus Benthicola marisminoris]